MPDMVLKVLFVHPCKNMLLEGSRAQVDCQNQPSTPNSENVKELQKDLWMKIGVSEDEMFGWSFPETCVVQTQKKWKELISRWQMNC